MILELDLGNTRAKWRILNERAGLVARGVDDIARWLNGDFPTAWFADVKRVRIASVLSSEIENQLVAKIQSKFDILPQVARSVAHCGGVSNAYAQPERLGVDRWLALIAAYQASRQATLVVDVGTALKVDAVDDAGQHIGGYIIPGVELMERALLTGTDRVRYESGSQLESVMLGVDTRSCVQNGIAAALLGAALIAVDQCRSQIGKCPALYISGGLGLKMKDRLEIVGYSDTHFDADLVLDGLRWALP